MSEIVLEVAWEMKCLLGEGPIWLDNEQALRFVDIKRGRLHRFDPATRARETHVVGGKPSFLLPSDDGLLVGSEHAIHRLDQGRLGAEIARLDQPPGNRTNDATVDGRGRLWFGTMDDAEEEISGAVWCLEAGELHRAGGDAVVTNGPAISPDDRWLYHVDSARREIWRFALNEGFCLENGNAIIVLEPQDGHPDGVVCDAEGCLWVALWDGWAVRRYSPEGKLLLQIDFPCARVTKLAFGGDDLRTAFVTTARIGLSDADLAKQPLAGSLFTFRSPVAGSPVPKVKLPRQVG